jgi:hypothetical protein
LAECVGDISSAGRPAGSSLKILLRELPDSIGAQVPIAPERPGPMLKEWFEELAVIENQRPEPDREPPLELHARLVHTLGNISLTAYDAELGAKPFEEKKQLMLDAGPLELNRQILDAPAWGREEIDARSRELGEIAIALWPGPVAGAAGAGAADA